MLSCGVGLSCAGKSKSGRAYGLPIWQEDSPVPTDHAEEHTRTDGLAAGCPRSAGDDHRQHAEDEGQRGHQDGAEAQACRMEGGLYEVSATVYLIFGKFHNQDGVLGGQSHQHDQPYLEIDVVFKAADRDAEIGTQGGHGQGQQDGYRHHPAFIPGREEQEHEQEHQCQHQSGLSTGLLFLIGQSAPFHADVVGQVVVGQAFDGLHGLS